MLYQVNILPFHEELTTYRLVFIFVNYLQGENEGMEKKPPVPLGWHAAAATISKVPGGDFPGGPVAKTPCSQCRGPRFNTSSGNWILHTATKVATCCNEDRRSSVPQLRPGAAK